MGEKWRPWNRTFQAGIQKVLRAHGLKPLSCREHDQMPLWTWTTTKPCCLSGFGLSCSIRPWNTTIYPRMYPVWSREDRGDDLWWSPPTRGPRTSPWRWWPQSLPQSQPLQTAVFKPVSRCGLRPSDKETERKLITLMYETSFEDEKCYSRIQFYISMHIMRIQQHRLNLTLQIAFANMNEASFF